MPAAEIEIGQVLARYCVTLDRRDWDGVRACFHLDAAIDYGRLVRGEVDALVAFLAAETASLDATLHLLTTCAIDVAVDVGRATVESYVVAEHRGPEDHPWCRGQVTAWVRYEDA